MSAPNDGRRGQPPKEHQFKPGQSGNPRGRPKQPRTNAEVISKLNQERIRMVVNGKPQWVSMFEASFRRVIQNCLTKGDPRSLKLLMEMLKEEGVDLQETMRSNARRDAQAVTDRLYKAFDAYHAEQDSVQSKIDASEDKECATVIGCSNCGPHLTLIRANHRIDPILRKYPTRFTAQIDAYVKRRNSANSAKSANSDGGGP